jgi:hypothetical protein
MTYQAETIAVKLPAPIYRRLKRVAEITYRSVEDVLASTVDAALPLDPTLPPDLADDVTAMTLMNDDALMAAAESSLSPAQQLRLQQLTEFGGQRQLLASEEAELAHLLESYNHSVLRRAKALAILAQRGYHLPDQAAFDQSDFRP